MPMRSKHETQFSRWSATARFTMTVGLPATTPPVHPDAGATMPALGDYHWDSITSPRLFREQRSRGATAGQTKEMQALFLTEAGKYQAFHWIIRLVAFLHQSRARPPGNGIHLHGVNAGIPFGSAPVFWTKTTPSAPRLRTQSGAEE